jgi:DNA-directed RNA polymerase subunit RPC12/RpoP
MEGRNNLPFRPSIRPHRAGADTSRTALHSTEVDNRMRTTIKCNCGQRIFSRDVMQQGYYVRQFGPSYVYIKFRCSRCKKLGEHFIKQEDWEEGLLRDNVTEVSPSEKARLDHLGPITVDEMIDFHYALENMDKLPDKIENE